MEWTIYIVTSLRKQQRYIVYRININGTKCPLSEFFSDVFTSFGRPPQQTSRNQHGQLAWRGCLLKSGWVYGTEKKERRHENEIILLCGKEKYEHTLNLGGRGVVDDLSVLELVLSLNLIEERGAVNLLDGNTCNSISKWYMIMSTIFFLFFHRWSSYPPQSWGRRRRVLAQRAWGRHPSRWRQANPCYQTWCCCVL